MREAALQSIREMIVERMLGEAPKQVEKVPKTHGSRHVVTMPGGAHYFLKGIGTEDRAYRREVGMRACLEEFSEIEYPEFLDSLELNGRRFVLLEYVEGQTLQKLWRADRDRMKSEMRRLGELLAQLQGMPVAQASVFLEHEDILFTDEHFARAQQMLSPYLSSNSLTSLQRCHETVADADLEEVVSHSDFGPHRIIARPDGEWVLTDFEHTAIAPFANDLSGTEVRLEREDFAPTDPFYEGYASVRSLNGTYESVRTAFKAYNLLTIVSYQLDHHQSPDADDLTLLEDILSSYLTEAAAPSM